MSTCSQNFAPSVCATHSPRTYFCPSREAIETVYPRTEVQLCIVHLVRASLNYVPWKLRRPVVADLQSIYCAATVAEAEQHPAELEAKWKAYPSVSQVWRRNWARITPFFNYPLGIQIRVASLPLRRPLQRQA